MTMCKWLQRDFIKTVKLLTILLIFTGCTKAASPKSGVTVLNKNKCYDGYRLYSSRMTEVAHLIDINGREVHKWSYPQGQLWHYAEMLPNGHLVAIIKETGKDRYPGMIFELDWGSKLVWKANVAAHHDFDRLPNGNTLVICNEYVVNEEIRPGESKSEVIRELTPDNNVVWEWHADQHLKEIAKLVPVKFPLPDYDILHMNAVESLPDGPAAKKDSRFKAGNILFSCLQIDTIGVIDRKTGKVVWAWGPGMLENQHMPTMISNGHILVYDNGFVKSKRTRVIELDPLTGKIVWQYQGNPPKSFYSPSRGSNQRLPNGNTFIADSDNGRLFEVTPEGQIVWEFFTPDFQKNKPWRMPLYRSICYPRALVDKLLAKYGGEKK